MSELRFDGRVAIVTGAGRGVGRGHALALAARGARVVVADLGGELDGSGSSSEPAQQVVREIQASGGEAVACHASVAEVSGARAIVDAALDSFGQLDVLVNNAGIADPQWFEEVPIEKFQRMLDVHYLGTVNMMQAAWPHFESAHYGHVVNTTSEGTFGPVPKCASYGGAKGAVLGLTISIGPDAARHGIAVNAVAPRATTRLSAPSVLAHAFDVPEETFAGVNLAPELVSAAAVFLAHESCELNGAILVSGGGRVLRLALVETSGLAGDALTPEDVADNLDTVMDMTSFQLMGGDFLNRVDPR